MSDSRRVYLDNAATSFPKPDAVHKAVLHYLRDLGNAVGRGATKTGIEVQRTVDQCRLRAARLFDVPRPEQVIFTFNGTDSLNLAIHGLLKPGDVALTTVWDHNSVLRPLSHFAATGGHTVIIGDDGRGQLDIQQLERELQVRSVRLVCVTHASNVTGIIQPIEEVIRLAHEHGALVLLDAAQTAGHLPMSFSKLNVDLLACPGHKGLLGPLGTGLLILRKDLAEELVPIRQGGTGTTSEQATQPTTLPDRFEAGNHNAPGLFGLEAALKWIDEKGVAKIQLQEEQLAIPLIAGLRSFQGLTVHSFADDSPRVGVVSVSSERVDPQVLASLLDEHFQIETRAGLHCAPMAHEALATKVLGGTVRISMGPFNTVDDIDRTLEAFGQIWAAL